MPSAKLDEKWSVEALTKHREHVESFGIKLDMMPITMTSASIDRAQMPAIMLGQSPERDRNIDDICTQIRNCAKAGIFAVKYNFTILGIPRSGRVKGRGPSTYSEFVLAKDANKDKPTHRRQSQRRRVLGAHHVLPRAGRAGRRGIQGEDGLPSAGSRRAAGLPRHRRSAARDTGRVEAVREDQGEPVPRPELLPGHGVGAAREAGRADPRRDPQPRRARSSTCTSGTSKAAT